MIFFGKPLQNSASFYVFTPGPHRFCLSCSSWFGTAVHKGSPKLRSSFSMDSGTFLVFCNCFTSVFPDSGPYAMTFMRAAMNNRDTVQNSHAGCWTPKSPVGPAKPRMESPMEASRNLRRSWNVTGSQGFGLLTVRGFAEAESCRKLALKSTGTQGTKIAKWEFMLIF